MRTKLLLALLLLSEAILPENLSLLDTKDKSDDWNRDYHLYIDFGTSDLLPAVGFGWRSKYHFVGADISCKIPFTFHSPVYYKSNASLLFYPNSEGHFYLGVGASTMVYILKFFDSDYHMVGTSFAVGSYEKKAKPRFWQLGIEFFPNVYLRWEGERIMKPFVSYSYGVCF